MDLTVRRLQQRALEQLQSGVRETVPLLSLSFRPGRHIAPEDQDATGWQPAMEGARWGGEDAWATFRAEFHVPQAWLATPARLALPLGGQGMAYLDGRPWQGLDANHGHVDLPASVRDGRPHRVVVEAYAIHETTAPRQPGTTCLVGPCRLERIDAEALAFAYDLEVGAGVLRALPRDHPARASLSALLLDAENLVDRRRPGSDAFAAGVRQARALLAEGLPRLANEYPQSAHVLAMGHAHIDTAWLWPLAQTRRKVARSWSSALRLMERYPRFHFLASQAQQYQWLATDEPELYRQVEARVGEGRWEPAAAMWVEPDVNLTAGESLVRQFLHGQRASETRFGRRCEVLWLPDTFGYSGALPQLMRGAGVPVLVTSKLSWNTTNRMPHDTFRWRGLDGSEVLAMFITAGIDPAAEPEMYDPENPLREISTYNGHVTPREVASAWGRYADKPLSHTVLYPFGWGDGGGGPTEHMLEVADRLERYPGMPRLTQGPAGAFLRSLHDRLIADPRTPVWDGEMYLEYHRGVYTGQAGVKAANRRAEHALHDAELWAAWAGLQGAGTTAWRSQLAEAWELALLNQFHDILPGSSIGEVYADQARDHARVQDLARTVRQEAQGALARQLGGVEDSLLVCNSLPWARRDLALDAATLGGLVPLDTDQKPLPVQPVTDLDGRERVLLDTTVPALGYRSLPLARPEPAPVDSSLQVRERRLENQFFILELDEAAQITRLFDKRYQREILAPRGVGNQLLAFEDKPHNFDAWEIDSYYVDKHWAIDAVSDLRVVEQGPLRAGVEIRREWDGSTVTQRILLYSTSPRIDFQTRIEWHHHQVLLKAAFPLNLRATKARYECAFGWVDRPTHRNTSWDAARFEVAAHRWADLSEADYGVSLLNDSKYGHDCLDSTLRLTLLKSAIDPDPQADQGIHCFSYALLPHGPDWTVADTVQAAYAFNLPATALRHTGGTGPLPAEQSLVCTTSRHAVIDTVKPAEDGDGLILRVYDCSGGRERTELVFAGPIKAARAVTILEEPDATVQAPDVAGTTLAFELLPFQVRSFRVHLA